MHAGGKIQPLLVRHSISILRRREPDTVVRDVIYLVEPLEEGHAVDEGEALVAVYPEVAHDEVDVVRRASDNPVELKVSDGERRRSFLEEPKALTARGNACAFGMSSNGLWDEGG